MAPLLALVLTAGPAPAKPVASVRASRSMTVMWNTVPPPPRTDWLAKFKPVPARPGKPPGEHPAEKPGHPG